VRRAHLWNDRHVDIRTRRPPGSPLALGPPVQAVRPIQDEARDAHPPRRYPREMKPRSRGDLLKVGRGASHALARRDEPSPVPFLGDGAIFRLKSRHVG